MKTIATAMLLFLGCLMAAAEQTQTDSKYGDRPASSVFDPYGVLTPTQHENISAPLRKIREDEGIDVIVVILPEIGEAPPEHVAKGFADIWIDTKLHAVVLHVPGHPDTPWIVPSNIVGLAVKAEAIKTSISDARQRARAEPDDYGKIRAASIEAADLIRYWIGGALIRSEEVITLRLQRQLAFEKRQRLLKLAAALAAAAAIPMILGFVALYLRLRENRPKHFPAIRRIQRLGAPYAGGNHAVTKSQRN